MRLERMAEHQIPAARIAQKLRRTEAAVRTEARKQRVMLAPVEKQLSLTDKRPYGGMRTELGRGRQARSMANATAPGRPSRSRPARATPARATPSQATPSRRGPQRQAPPEQSETLF
jgi:hypothetical protein